CKSARRALVTMDGRAEDPSDISDVQDQMKDDQYPEFDYLKQLLHHIPPTDWMELLRYIHSPSLQDAYLGFMRSMHREDKSLGGVQPFQLALQHAELIVELARKWEARDC